MGRIRVQNLGTELKVNGHNDMRRRLRIALDLDLTGHGRISEQRLEQLALMITQFVESSAKTVGLGNCPVTGLMEYVGGPTHVANISGPDETDS